MNEVDSMNLPNKKLNINFKIHKNITMFLLNMIITVVLVIGTLFILNNSDKKPTIPEEPDFSGVIQIGELVTLKCFYHNVAEYEQQPTGLFQYGLFQVGYKKFWIEYTGTVEMGIDISKVKIAQPDEEGIVRVYIPEVEKFRVDHDSTSIQEPVFEKGVFTSITTEEKTKALSQAQSNMEAAAKSDQLMIQRAHENAKTLIKQYIINVGISLEKEYDVVWVDTPQELN